MRRFVFEFECFVVECWGKDITHAIHRAVEGHATRLWRIDDGQSHGVHASGVLGGRDVRPPSTAPQVQGI